MSVVIIGGHDRMVCQYKKICKEHKCKAKVFTQMPAKLSSQIASPDLIVRAPQLHDGERLGVLGADKALGASVMCIPRSRLSCV